MNRSKQRRRRLLVGLLSCASLSVVGVWAQSFPSQPVRMLIGVSAGGSTDTVGRSVARAMTEVLGQPVVVENRPGASTVLATQAAATAPPNGYTLVMINITTADATALKSNLPYDLERDLAPISMVASGPLILAVNVSSPVRSVKDLIALAKTQPGKLNIAHEGVGGVTHLAGAMFASMAGVELFYVPYKGGSESTVALVSGNVDVGLLSFSSALSMIQAGKIRPIAITTKTRSSVMPSLPTVDEAGVPGYDQSIWFGLMAPAGTPPDVIGKLNAAVRKAMENTQVRETMKSGGLEGVPSSPEEFAAVIRDEIKRSRELGKQAGIKLD